MSKSQLADIWKETLKLLEKDIKPTFETVPIYRINCLL